MNRFKYFLLASGFAFLALGLFAQNPQSIIAEGNMAYTEGLYTDAIDSYLEVADAGFEAPELFYNLGNAYFKMNDFPHAILWYERAHRLDPGNEDIDYNLKVANSKIADKIDPLPELFYIKWYKSVVNLFPVNTWAVQTIAYFILTLVAVTLYFISRKLFLRKTGFWAAFLFFALTLFTLLFSVSGYNRMKTLHEAIVFDPTITVRSSPDEKSVDLFVIHEGTKVRLLDKIGEWYEIRIDNGSVGWLPEESLEEI